MCVDRFFPGEQTQNFPDHDLRIANSDKRNDASYGNNQNFSVFFSETSCSHSSLLLEERKGDAQKTVLVGDIIKKTDARDTDSIATQRSKKMAAPPQPTPTTTPRVYRIGESTEITRSLTQTEMADVMRIVQGSLFSFLNNICFFPDNRQAAMPEVKTARVVRPNPAAHPRKGFTPVLGRCMFNALAARSLPMLTGYRAYAAVINNRIARVELIAHVWNLSGTEWLDTTPPEDPEGKEILTVMDETGKIATAMATYLRKPFEIASRIKIPDIGLSPQDQISFMVANGLDISDDCRLAVPIHPEATSEEKQQIQSLMTVLKMSNSVILYAGPGTGPNHTFAPRMRIADEMTEVMTGQLQLQMRDRLYELRCCWTCKKPNAANVCGGCHVARYCSPECQKKDWSGGHKADHATPVQEVKK